MKKVPTAREFLQNLIEENNHDSNIDLEDALIEFSKLHVQEALQRAFKNARLDVDGTKVIAYGDTKDKGFSSMIHIDKHSITNAYPVSNIK